jgi:PCI domain
MASKDYEEAGKTFFQAFKSYDEAGDASRLRCLKYLVLASMLHASTINPFDSQEARPYRDDVEIVAMTNLVQAFHNNDIQTFESILKNAKGRKLMEDAFIREHVQDLLRTIRTQVLGRLLIPYKRITLQALCTHLNDISVADVEALVVRLIHNGSLHAKIDKTAGILIKMDPGTSSSASSTGNGGGGIMSSNTAGSSTGGGGAVAANGASSSGGASGGGGAFNSSNSSAVAEEHALCDEMDRLANMLQDFSTQVTSMRLNKENSSSSGSGGGAGPHMMMGPGMSTMRSLVH